MNATATKADPWKILIVDDEPEIHLLTKTVLRGVDFEEIPLEFFSAYNASQTRDIMKSHDDIALVLMDVIMEEDNTGLELVRYIREDLGNHMTRIILRTGHPGEAPERQVIIDYEINDYKEKVDLTSTILYNSVITSLRNYRDLLELEEINRTLEESRAGLTRVIESSSVLFEVRSLDDFHDELLHQTALVLGFGRNLRIFDPETREVIRSSGDWKDSRTAGPKIDGTGETNGNETRVFIREDRIFCFLRGLRDTGLVLEIERREDTDENALQMLEIFCGNAQIVYSKLNLEEDSQTTQTELIDLLGDVVEERDYEDGEIVSHINRVSDFVILMARELGYPEEDIALLRNAVPLHDIGKIGIHDGVLRKPGRLTEDEFRHMKEHSQIGYEILRTSPRKLFRLASVIAWQHHERWDGNGYPQGLAGEAIHELGRLTCIADVFDALTSERVYRKEAWSIEKTLSYIRDGREMQFDPKLADIFLSKEAEIREIVTRHRENSDELKELASLRNKERK